MKKQIGFIGLGIMGRGMAASLLKAGYEVTVFNRTVERAQALRAQGANVADHPAGVAERADIIILIVSDDRAVEEITLGPNGLADKARRGSIIIDSSTVAPATSRKMAAALAERGVAWLDAPVTGSKAAAETGAVTFLVGGDRPAYEACGDLFQAMGRKAIYVGGRGMGAQAKLCLQLIVGATYQAFCESAVLAAKAGIAPELLLELINNSGAQSRIIEMKAPLILSRDFSPHFPLKLMYKDMGLAVSSAQELAVPAPVTALVRELLGQAQAAGYGELDFSAGIKLTEERAGIGASDQRASQKS